MSGPHPALVALAGGRGLPRVDDSAELIRSAYEHRLNGVLWTELRDRPEASAAEWRVLLLDDLRARARRRHLWATLGEVANRLDGIGVEIAAVKGVTAEQRWYERPGERPCTDLDVLVSPGDLGRVDEIVATIQPGHPATGHVRELVRRNRLQALELEVDGVCVDLHFDLLKLGIPCRQRGLIWERTLPFTLPAGAGVRVLDPEIALVHFLVHLNKDRFGFLLGFVDVVRLMDAEMLDWTFIEHFLRNEGLELPVLLSLEVVLDTLGRDALHAPGGRGGRARVWRALWRPTVRLSGEASKQRFHHRTHVLPLLARGRTADAVRLWARLAFPPRALVAHAHPERKGPYLWRLLLGRAESMLRRRRRVAQLRRSDGGATA